MRCTESWGRRGRCATWASCAMRSAHMRARLPGSRPPGSASPRCTQPGNPGVDSTATLSTVPATGEDVVGARACRLNGQHTHMPPSEGLRRRPTRDCAHLPRKRTGQRARTFRTERRRLPPAHASVAPHPTCSCHRMHGGRTPPHADAPAGSCRCCRRCSAGARWTRSPLIWSDSRPSRAAPRAPPAPHAAPHWESVRDRCSRGTPGGWRGASSPNRMSIVDNRINASLCTIAQRLGAYLTGRMPSSIRREKGGRARTWLRMATACVMTASKSWLFVGGHTCGGGKRGVGAFAGRWVGTEVRWWAHPGTMPTRCCPHALIPAGTPFDIIPTVRADQRPSYTAHTPPGRHANISC